MIRFLQSVMMAMLVWTVQTAAAEEAAMQKYRNFLPEQLLALSEDIQKSEVPISYLGAANGAVSPFGEIFDKLALNQLMYGAISDLDGARKAFQRDLGESQTGQLTVWQLNELGYRSSRQNMTNVTFFPLDFGGWMNDSSAWVGGTLEMIDERIAYPINHVDIKCDKSTSSCTYRQIALTFPDRNSWSQSYTVGEVIDEVYLVTRWDQNQIDAIPITVGTCRINQLSLNFAAQEFFEIAKNVGGDCTLENGNTLPKLEKPRISRIIDGQQIIFEEFNSIKDEAYGFLSTDFQSHVEEAKKQTEIQEKQ